MTWLPVSCHLHQSAGHGHCPAAACPSFQRQQALRSTCARAAAAVAVSFCHRWNIVWLCAKLLMKTSLKVSEQHWSTKTGSQLGSRQQQQQGQQPRLCSRSTTWRCQRNSLTQLLGGSCQATGFLCSTCLRRCELCVPYSVPSSLRAHLCLMHCWEPLHSHGLTVSQLHKVQGAPFSSVPAAQPVRPS